MKNLVYLMLLVQFSTCQSPKEIEEIHKAFVLSDKMFRSTQISEVKQTPLRNELSFFGKITVDNNKMIDIYPVVGGSVLSVNVELGDYVQKGQLLATIRSTEVASIEKENLDARNDLLVAKNNLKVAQELFENKLNTERDVLEAKSNLEKSQSQLRRIEEVYRIYNLKPGAIYEVRAPMSGFIIHKNINQDMLLRSDRTDNIFDIAEIKDVWAIANVTESDIAQIKLGEDASVTTLSYPNIVFNGKVDKIFNIIDPATKALKVRIKLSNPDYMLKPEMRANIKISYLEEKKMLAVPSAALIFDKSKYFVMVFKERNNIETRQIELFRQVGDLSYISSGLEMGEKVMITNQLLVYDAIND